MSRDRGRTGRLRSNRDWEAWGRLDPLYGVAALPGRSMAGARPWTSSEFLELGARDWDHFRPHWEQYGLSRETCLEIGCGAGRMTAQLAREFDVVHGVDVSEEMIRLAARHVEPHVVRFYVSDGVHLPVADSSVASVFSTHVFQHLGSVEAAAATFREIHRVLRVDGTLMIHLPIVSWPHGSAARAYRLADRFRVRIGAGLARARRFAHEKGLLKLPPMQMTSYDVDWLYRTLSELGFSDVEIRFLFGDSPMAIKHPFLFARKVAPRSRLLAEGS